MDASPSVPQGGEPSLTRRCASADARLFVGPKVEAVTRLFDASRYQSSAYGQYDVTANGREFVFVRDGMPTVMSPRDGIRVVIDWPLLAAGSAR